MPSRRDNLTNLLHEEYLEEGLEDEMSRARRFGRDLSLLLLEPIIPEKLKPDMLYVVLKALAQGAPKDGCDCQPDSPLAWQYMQTGRYDRSWDVVHRAQQAHRWIQPELLEQLKRASGRER